MVGIKRNGREGSGKYRVQTQGISATKFRSPSGDLPHVFSDHILANSFSFYSSGSCVVYGWLLAFSHGANGVTVSGGTDMAKTAHDQTSRDAHVVRGTPRRTAGQHTPSDIPTMLPGGVFPDRRAAIDRRRTAKAIPMGVAGNALGWAGVIAAMTAANLAALLAYASIIQF